LNYLSDIKSLNKINKYIKKSRGIFKNDLHLTELVKGSGIAYVFQIISILGGYLFFFVAAQYFDASGVGVFSTCWSVLIIGSVIGKLGFDSSVVRFISQASSQKKDEQIHEIYTKSFAVVFIASLLIFILTWVFAPYLTTLLFKNYTNVLFIRLTGLAVVFYSIMRLNAESLRGIKKITEFSVYNHGVVYFSTLVILLSVHVLFGETIILIITLNAAIFILMVLSFIRLWKNNIIKIKKVRLFGGSFSLKRALSISIPMMLTNSLFLIMNSTDILMLSVLKNEALVGTYNIALKIAALNTVSLVAINSIATPKFVEIREKYSFDTFRRFVWQTSAINILVTLPVFLIILIFPGLLLSIFGKEFILGTGALIVLAGGHFFTALSGATIPILNMTGKEKMARNIILSGTILNIILNYLLIPLYGIEGAAISTASSTVFWNLVAVLYIYKIHGFITIPVEPLVFKMKKLI